MSSTVVPTLEEFLDKERVPSGRFLISIDGYENEFYFRDNRKATTVVLFSTGHDGDFARASTRLGEELLTLQNVNVLLVKDTSSDVHESVNTRWFLGNSKQPTLVETLSRICAKIVGENRAIYLGESDGGFAALLYASMHPMAMAVPINPQINLDPQRMPGVQKWMESAWTDKDRNIGKSLLAEYGDLASKYSTPHKVRVVYVQNTMDAVHFEDHYKTFKMTARPQAVAGVSLVAAGSGHVALSTNFIARLTDYIASLDSWGRVDVSEITRSYVSSVDENAGARVNKMVGTKRDTSRYIGSGITEFADLDSFLSSSVPSGMSTFDYHGKPFDLLVRRKTNASTTIIVFHPAAAGDNITRPFFVGTTLTDKLPVNAVFIADPSLEWDDDLRISWFAGNQRQPVQQDLPRILSHVISALGSKNNIFYGASAGGFAALYYSSLFSDSLAITINPQTKITGYGKNFVAKYGEACWGIRGADASIKTLNKYVIEDLTSHYERVQPNSVLYIQNNTDWHLGVHMKPFISKINAKNKFMKIVSTWGNGHVPPPVDYQEKILRLAIESDGEWSQITQFHNECTSTRELD